MDIMPVTDGYINQIKAQYESDTKKTESFAEALNAAAISENDAELLHACQEFESYFLNLLFKEMRKTVGENDNALLKKSNAEKIFQEMLDEQISISASKTGGIGLAAFMYKQMKRNPQSQKTASPG